MPIISNGGDELTHLPEAPSATENGGTQVPYGISQHKTIAEEEGRMMGAWGLAPEKFFRATPSRT